jgi:hypothetical protein
MNDELLALASNPNSSPDERRRRFSQFFREPPQPTDAAWRNLAVHAVCDPWSTIRKEAVKGCSVALRSADTAAIDALLERCIAAVSTPPVQWYVSEGALLLLTALPPQSGAAWDAAHTALVVPCCAHQQLPVRTLAGRLVARAAAADGAALGALMAQLLSNPEDECATMGALELALLVPKVLIPRLLDDAATTERLASHGDAAVRQLMASALCAATETLAQQLARVAPMVTNSDVSRWPIIETGLMALQSSVVAAITDTSATFEQPSGGDALLRSVAQHALSAQFELRRVAEQLLPSLVQLLVRAAASAEDFALIVACSDALKQDALAEHVAWYGAIRSTLQASVPWLSAAVRGMQFTTAVSRVITAVYMSADGGIDAAVQQDTFSDVAKYLLDWSRARPSEFVASSAFALFADVLADPDTELHVQCILLTIIHELCAAAPSPARKFGFVDREDFSPPALVDGGDNVQSGTAWLRQSQRPAVADAASYPAAVPATVAQRLLSISLSPLLTTRSTELRVVALARRVVVGFATAAVVPPALVAEATLRRLDAVVPDWRHEGAAASGGAAPSAGGWDDSSDDDEGVAGVSLGDEVVAAKAVIEQLHFRDASPFVLEAIARLQSM